MSNRLKEIVKIIQAKKGWNTTQVAESIGYSRGRLSTLMNQDESSEIEKVLEERFSSILQNVTLPDMTKKSLPIDKWQAEYLEQLRQENLQLKKDKEDLRADKERLQKQLDDYKKEDGSNLKTVLYLAKVLSARQLGQGKVMLQALEVVAKEKPNELVKAADKIIVEAFRELGLPAGTPAG